MRKFVISIIMLIMVSNGCYAASGISSFDIPVGTERSQLGFLIKGSDDPFFGPVAIAVFKENIYILDEVNSRVNIYSTEGVYKDTIIIPKGLPYPKGPSYNDIAISPEGKVILFTSQGIYTLSKKEGLLKLHENPVGMSTALSMSIDKSGNLLLNGRKKGWLMVGILNGNGKFKELTGDYIFSSFEGLIGLVKSNYTYAIMKDGKAKINRKFSEDYIPIGLTDDMSIYFVEPQHGMVRIHRVDKEGKVFTKEIKFHSVLIEDAINFMKFFRVSRSGEVFVLEANDDICTVYRVSF